LDPVNQTGLQLLDHPEAIQKLNAALQRR